MLRLVDLAHDHVWTLNNLIQFCSLISLSCLFIPYLWMMVKSLVFIICMTEDNAKKEELLVHFFAGFSCKKLNCFWELTLQISTLYLPFTNIVID